MAICTNCGAILHKDDVFKHICKAENVAVKGTEKIPTTVDATITAT
jgi:5-methylcytosine-specific restriction endonuclease McrA